MSASEIDDLGGNASVATTERTEINDNIGMVNEGLVAAVDTAESVPAYDNTEMNFAGLDEPSADYKNVINIIELQATRELAENTQREAQSQTKFAKFKKGKVLKEMFDDIVRALQDRALSIAQAIEVDASIACHLAGLHHELNDAHEFIMQSKPAHLSLTKNRLKVQSHNLETRLRAAGTLLFEGVETFCADKVNTQPLPPAEDSLHAVPLSSQTPSQEGPELVDSVEVQPGVCSEEALEVTLYTTSNDCPSTGEHDAVNVTEESAPSGVAHFEDADDLEPLPAQEGTTEECGNQDEKEAAITASDSSEYYAEGIGRFHGIEFPRNYMLAFKLFVQAATLGHADAAYMVSQCLRAGSGVGWDEVQAEQWLERAVLAGSAEAMNDLAHTLLRRAKSTIDSQAASSPSSVHQDELIHSEGRQGGWSGLNGSTRSLSGETPLRGSDVEQNRVALLQRGVRLLLEAAALGHVDSHCSLGRFYAQVASCHGNNPVAVGLISEEAGEVVDALAWYEKAIAKGSVRAMNLAGLLYFDGIGSDPALRADKVRAFELFTEAALAGCASACCNAGLCLELGVGVPMSLPRAIDMYRQGATLNSPGAKYALGYLLVSNALSSTSDEVLDTSPLLAEGLQWLRVAADDGVAEASYQLGRLHELGRGVPLDYLQALSLYTRAADLGHAKAALCAANVLFHDCGVSPTITPGTSAVTSSRTRALHYYRLAASRGLGQAMNAVGLLLEEEAVALLAEAQDDDVAAALRGRDLVAEACRWYFVAAETGLVEAACNLTMLLTRTPREVFSAQMLDAVIGRSDVMKQLNYWLTEAVGESHPRTPLFEATLVQLRGLQGRCAGLK